MDFAYIWTMKKHILLTLAAVIYAALSQSLCAQPSSRQSWNEGWTFTKDGKTTGLDLPHDWGVEGPFNIEFPGETGKLGWWGKAEYSKTLRVEESGKNYFLDLDGVMQ